MALRRWDELLPRVERLLDEVERRLGGTSGEAEPDEGALAYRWSGSALEAVRHPDLFQLERLIGVERSLERLRANVTSFVRGAPAVDALLYGERGTGKSSAVRGLLREFAPNGLRLIEVRPAHLRTLPRIFALIRKRPERFLLFCDDLSFEAGDASYKELKAVLDGGVEERPANLLIVATSNRRHLIPEQMSENLAATRGPAGELHPSETTEEKISLSDRFGLLLPFFAFDPPTYLRIVEGWAQELGLAGRLATAELHAHALRIALERGSRSGRTARHACILILQQLPESKA